MTAANDDSFTASPQRSPGVPAPESSTAIQAGAPVGESSIPLPPIEAPSPEPITPEELAREIRRLDWVLLLLVFGLAFLLASFSVRNTDFFLHLAQGRLYAHGEFNFGTDQFTYTRTNYWSNPAWLYDMILYGVTTIAGGVESPVAGAILVGLKAILVMLMAWFMLKISRPGLSRWAPALCTGLALVAMSPRLLYQPSLISFLFLAITLYILQRPGHETSPDVREAGKKSPLRIYWLLPVLFAFWVNLDGWWILGPATLALYLIGQALQQLLAPIRTGEDVPPRGQLTILAAVLIVGLAACFLNPHHYHVFTLPALISPAFPSEVFQLDRLFKYQFQSPLNDVQGTGQPLTPAVLAYLPLLGFGLVSFMLSLFGEWRWWRFIVWLAFAALSAYRVRTVPFFAVVSGPIMALNFQDFAAVNFGRLPRVDRSWRAWSLGGRMLSLVVGVALILAAWPGWLHGRPTESTSQFHRVGWDVHVDPSLRLAVEQLAAWRSQGVLKPEENGFNFSPDIANYCAWFCADPKTGLPMEKAFFDYRMELFPRDVAALYIDIRQGLIESDQAGEFAPRPVNWQDTFRRQKITHVIINRNDPGFYFAWIQFLQDWPQWSLVAIPGGRTAIFGWQDPRKPREPSRLPRRLDFAPLAFGPHALRAPDKAPARAPQPRDLLTRFWKGAPIQPPEEEEGDLYLQYFQLVSQQWFKYFLAGSDIGMWSGTAGMMGNTPAVGTVVAPGTLVLNHIPLQFALYGSPNAIQFLMQGKDQGPPAAPVLAIRAARNAIARSPDYWGSYARLATAYSYLWRLQEDHWVGQRQMNAGFQFPRQQLREIQIATAWEQALKLRPTDITGHEALLELYAQMNYLDLALEHLQEVVNLSKSPNFREAPEDYKQRLENQQKGLKTLEDEVRRQRNEFELQATNKPVLEKARIALGRKLGKRALELLLQADATQMDRQEMDLLVSLLLTTGAGHASLQNGMDDVRQLVKDVGPRLGANYERYGFLMEAAAGNYADADAYIAAAIDRLDQEYRMAMLAAVRNQAFGGRAFEFLPQARLLLQNVSLIADYKVLRAMVALEAGDTAAVERECQEALDMNNGKPFQFESKTLAANYLRLIKAAGAAQ